MIAAAFVTGIWVAVGDEDLGLAIVRMGGPSVLLGPGGFWAFLTTATLPVGIGLCLLIRGAALHTNRA